MKFERTCSLRLEASAKRQPNKQRDANDSVAATLDRPTWTLAGQMIPLFISLFA
jgi:hypothetical protein